MSPSKVGVGAPRFVVAAFPRARLDTTEMHTSDRYAKGRDLDDLEDRFGYSTAHLSSVIRFVEEHIFTRSSGVLNDFHPTLVRIPTGTG